MVEILAALHTQTGVAIAADDSPLRREADLTFHGSLKTALDRIADAFDYRWFPSKSVPKAILFQKRFKSNEDHPQFHQKDMVHIAREVCRCLQNPLYVSGMEGEPRELLQILYHKLRDDQIRRLQSGHQLTIGELDQAQKLLLDQSIYSVALKGITDGWIALRENLSSLEHSRLEMKVYSGTRCLAITLPASNGRDQTINLRFFPSNGNDASPEVYESVATGAANSPSPPLARKVQTSDDEDLLAQKTTVRMPDTSLIDLLKSLSVSSSWEVSSEDYLEQHRLSLWVKDRSVLAALELITELNDWNWNKPKFNHIHIARPSAGVPSSYAEVSNAFARSLPPDYRHFLGWGISSEDWLKGDDTAGTQVYRKINDGGYMAMRMHIRAKLMSGGTNDAATARIWPAVPRSLRDKKTYPYKEWTPQIKERVLWNLLLLSLQKVYDERDLDVIQGNLMPYERQPETACIMLSGKQGEAYTAFGYGTIALTPDGDQQSLGTFCDLEWASRPMALYVQRAFERY